MSARTFAAQAFFEALSDDIARALAAHLQLPEATSTDPQSSVYARWQRLDEAQQHARESELAAIANMGSAHARGYLVRVAQKRWASTRPDWLPFIIAWSTADLAARMYLEDPHGFQEAHRHYRVDQREQRARYRGQFVADVVPSFDRRERMKQVMRAHFAGLGATWQAFDHVTDGELAFFMAEQPSAPGGLPTQLHEEALAPYPVWLLFDFSSCELSLRAPSLSDHERLRASFAEVFVGFSDYFEAPEAGSQAADECEADAFARERIEHVTVQRVAIRPDHPEVQRITIEFAPGLALPRARFLLEHHGIRLARDTIEGAKLSFVFSGSASTRSIELKSDARQAQRVPARERSLHRYMKDWTLDADRRDPLVAAACSGGCE